MGFVTQGRLGEIFSKLRSESRHKSGFVGGLGGGGIGKDDCLGILEEDWCG
jgi:hypothetical protein